MDNNISTIKINASAKENRIAEILDSVRAIYASTERFDAKVATALEVDRSGLRAINAMHLGPVSPGHLGQVLGLASGSVTALLDRLEAGGHIERVISKTDRRRRDARLTITTRQRAGALYGKLGESIENGFSVKTNAEIKRAADTINQVANAFDEAARA